jgi:hypothetical protein
MLSWSISTNAITHNRVNIRELLSALGKLNFDRVEPVCKLPSRSSTWLCVDATASCVSERAPVMDSKTHRCGTGGSEGTVNASTLSCRALAVA